MFFVGHFAGQWVFLGCGNMCRYLDCNKILKTFQCSEASESIRNDLLKFYFYCLPVFVVCDGIVDCPHHEDETDCDNFRCPGFYRCRMSVKCLHVDHLCDGEYHCPQQDDEAFCKVDCPELCTCYGHAYFCGQEFAADRHPNLRYVDAQGTGMGLHRFVHNRLLVHLGVARCSISRLEGLHLPNLHSLDVSDNQLHVLDAAALSSTPKLRELSVAGNPLTSALFTDSLSPHTLPNLRLLDLSAVAMADFNLTAINRLHQLELLNLSACAILTVHSEGFQPNLSIKSIDFRGSPLGRFPRDFVRNIGTLEILYTDNFRLCCPENLPPKHDAVDCLSPEVPFSSCTLLLQRPTFQAWLAVVAGLAVWVNAGCFLLQLWAHSTHAHVDRNVLGEHLFASDLLVGLHATVLSVANQVFKNEYVLKDSTWTGSAVCQAAGFLCLLAHETSTCLLFLILMDNALTLTFFPRRLLTTTSRRLCCLLVWPLCCVLAAAPLLSPGRFYGQTPACMPLLASPLGHAARRFVVGLFLGFNSVLGVAMIAAKVILFRFYRSHFLAFIQAPDLQRAIDVAQRFGTIATAKILSWLLIACAQLLVNAGVAVPVAVDEVLLVMVIPFNAAVDRLAFGVQLLEERRLHTQRRRLLQRAQIKRPA